MRFKSNKIYWQVLLQLVHRPGTAYIFGPLCVFNVLFYTRNDKQMTMNLVYIYARFLVQMMTRTTMTMFRRSEIASNTPSAATADLSSVPVSSDIAVN